MQRVQPGSRSALMTLAGLVLSLGVLFAAVPPAVAQDYPIYPLVRYGDQNNINLVDGTYLLHEAGVSIGQPGSGGLSYSRDFINGFWSSNYGGSVYDSGSSATVTIDRTTVQFTGSTTYTPVVADGSTLSKTVISQCFQGYLNYWFACSQYTYTSRDGIIYRLQSLPRSLSGAVTIPELTEIDYPSGEKVWLNISGSQDSSGNWSYWLYSITNNYGYALNFVYDGNGMISSVTAVNTACNPSVCPGPWPTVHYTTTMVSGPGSSIQYNYTTQDPVGNTAHYTYVAPSGIGAGASTLTIQAPSSSASAVTVNFDSHMRVTSFNNGAVSWTYAYATSTGANPALTTTATNPYGKTRIVSSSVATALPATDQNELGKTTTYIYNSGNQLAEVIHPEFDSEQYGYDARGNQISAQKYDKTGANWIYLSQAGYPTTCSLPFTPVNCNKPLWTQDGAGNQTTFSWDPGHGGLLVQTSPAAPNGVSPQTRISYSPITITPVYGVSTSYQIQLPTVISVCRTAAAPACVGTADETTTTISYVGSSTGQPMSTTVAGGSPLLSAQTALTYDAVDNVHTVKNPMNAVTTYWYNAARQLWAEVDPDVNGHGNPAALKFTYTPDDLVQEVDVGTAASGNPSSFSLVQSMVTKYDAQDRKVQDQASGGGQQTLTQYNYDALNRPNCTAVRMNSAWYGSLPDACAQTPAGPDGPDRISQVGYDDAGQVLTMKQGVGASASPPVYDTVLYGDDGEKQSDQDANGNVTRYTYDGYNRLSQVNYPVPSGGAATNETYTYNAAGNVHYRYLRDGTMLTFNYDALGRLSSQVVPGQGTSTYAYDNLGNVTSAALSGSPTVSADYDGLGRKWHESQTQGTTTLTFTFGYDAAGGRTSIQWPDGFTATYSRDTAERVTSILDNVGAHLADYTYYDLGSPQSVSVNRPINNINTSVVVDGLSRLQTLTHTFVNASAQTQSYGFSYNAAGQIKSKTASNILYALTPSTSDNRTYVSNALNQTTTAGPHALGFDVRGNLNTDTISGGATTTYSYSELNQLTGATGSVSLVYDAVGRLVQTGSSTTATTQFAYDGDQLMAEYDGSGALKRRYVPGPSGADDPIVWYDIAGGTTTRNWLIPDQQGSVVGVANDSGSLVGGTAYAYDEYGVPKSGQTGRFQYTGQLWIPELAMYHYKARTYSPYLGRFLQTDPLGYRAGMHLYAYVGNDPVNHSDPNGMQPPDCPDSEPDDSVACAVPVPNITPPPPTNLSTVTVTGNPCSRGQSDCSIYQVWNPTPQYSPTVYAGPGGGAASGQPQTPQPKPLCVSPGPKFQCNAKGELEFTPEYQKQVCANYAALQDGATKANDFYTAVGVGGTFAPGKASPIIALWVTFNTLVSSITTGAGYRPLGLVIVPKSPPPPGCE